MTRFAPYSSSAHSAAYDAFTDGHLGDQWDNSPDDRVGAPPRRSRRKMAAWAVLGLLVSGNVGWAYVDHDDMLAHWSGWLQRGIAIASAVFKPQPDGAAEPKPAALIDQRPQSQNGEPAAEPGRAAADPQPPPSAEPVAVAEPPVPPQAQAVAPSPPPPAIAAAAPPTPVDEAQVQKTIPTVLAPYQKRAAAVGLHTEISRMLLESLSEADYRNAAVAIRKALAEKADDAVVLWPHKSTVEQAQFQVHFVAGAPAGCRRYVVTVAKQGWLTTALPVEKCGLDRGVRRG